MEKPVTRKQWNSREEYLAARQARLEELARIGEARRAYLEQQPKLSPDEVYQQLKERYGRQEEAESSEKPTKADTTTKARE